MNAEFGASNAGKAWLRRIESVGNTGPDPDLIRARSVARQTEGNVTITGATVEAALAERGRQRMVRLIVPAWNNHDAQIVAALLNDFPLSPLDDVPDSLLANLRVHDIDLAPRLEEMQSKPAQTPRRFILAAVYKLIQLLDEEPQHAITLRAPAMHRQPQPGSRDLVPLAQIDVDAFYTRPITATPTE